MNDLEKMSSDDLKTAYKMKIYEGASFETRFRNAASHFRREIEILEKELMRRLAVYDRNEEGKLIGKGV